jgi:hypothetical protein
MIDETHSQQQITVNEANKATTQTESDTKAKAQAVEVHEKEKAVYDRIVKKHNEKKRLTDAEKIILELASSDTKIHDEEKAILQVLFKTFIDEDEAKAAERRRSRARKKLLQDKLDKLHNTRERHKVDNALHVANKLYELGILNNDASYKIPAEIFYSFIKENLHLLNTPLETTSEKQRIANLEQAPQPTTVTTPVVLQPPTQLLSSQ